jgi:DNA-binding response OmpR family regulator
MIRVLYVDDEPDIREIAQLSLSLDPEFDVRTAGSGEEALSIAAEWQPAIVLLDVMMPVMDGPAALSRMRERGIDTPVVFVTARAQRAEMPSFSMLDAKGVIAKPFDPVSLAARVRVFL